MENKQSTLSNLLWKFAERISAQMVTLVVSIILARRIAPEYYGIISIVMVFITVANVFVSAGLGNALIQKKDADALDYSSVLYFNIAVAFVLYTALFAAAPFISAFYRDEYALLTPVLRVLGIRLILSAVNSVQQAYVSKKMMFQKFFFATLTGTVISAFVGIYLAYNGWGVWALVAQYLTNTTMDTIVLGISMGKWPLLRFSWSRIRPMLSFGSHVLAASLLITLYEELRALIVGKVYTPSDLAYYDRGKRFPDLAITNINASISVVLFPKMANEQNDLAQMKKTMKKSIRFSSFVLCPIMLGFASVAEPFIRLLLTDSWLPCAPLLRMFCIAYLFQPVHSANMQAIKALGRGKTYFRLEATKKAVELAVLAVTMKISVHAMVSGMAVCAAFFTYVNAIPSKKLVGYSFREQMQDLLPYLGNSLVMAGIVCLLSALKLPLPMLFFMQVLSGIIVYVGLCALERSPELRQVISILKNRILLQKISSN